MIKIVTDSSLALPQHLIDQYDITVVPLSVLVDGVFHSDLDLKGEGEFFTLMTTSKHLPKTSQPPVGLFAEAYDQLAKAGATEILAIHLAGSLSGTVEASRQGAILAGVSVTVVDSQTADQALGFQVLEAARLAQAGANLRDILKAVEQVRQRTDLYLGLSNLENLVKGGRVSRVSGLIGSLLNIRILMTLQEGHLIPILKGRGQKTFNRWLDEFKGQLAQRSVRQLGVSYAGDKALAEDIAEQLGQVTGITATVMETSSVIQTHTGSGAFAVMVVYD